MAEFTFDKHVLTGTIFGLRHERANISPNGTVIPPAMVITDSEGGMWTLGHEYIVHRGSFEWNVIRNDIDMDITAQRIEVKNGRVCIFTPYGGGWKQWSYNRRHWI